MIEDTIHRKDESTLNLKQWEYKLSFVEVKQPIPCPVAKVVPIQPNKLGALTHFRNFVDRLG